MSPPPFERERSSTRGSRRRWSLVPEVADAPVSEHDAADRLSRGDAAKMLGRIVKLARPYRRAGFAVMGVVAVYTLTVLAGPLLLKIAIDRGISHDNGRVLNIAVATYVVVAVISWVTERAQILMISRVGEGFLRDAKESLLDFQW